MTLRSKRLESSQSEVLLYHTEHAQANSSRLRLESLAKLGECKSCASPRTEEAGGQGLHDQHIRDALART